MKKLDRALAWILTAAFLGLIAAACLGMLRDSGRDLFNAARRMDKLEPYLTDGRGPFDMLQARIASVQAELGEDMWQKERFGWFNSALQKALGKRMINTGNQNMVTLKTGHLYDLQEYAPLDGACGEIAAMREDMLGDTPFLFVYEHPTLYDPDMLPDGYEGLDHAWRMADEAVAYLRGAGVDVMDSREVLNGSGYALEDLLMVTDQHWSTLSAIVMARAIAGKIAEMTGAAVEPSLLNPEGFDTIRHEKLFIGKYGQRLGEGAVTPDDIVEYLPRYDTHIIRDTKLASGRLEHAEGPFRETVTKLDRLEPDPGRTWNKLAYTYYGQTEAYCIYENPDAPDVTVLLLKDSYSAPIATFLSLCCRHVVAVDLRKDVEPLNWWLENYDFDCVVMAYSLQMLKNEKYAFE